MIDMFNKIKEKLNVFKTSMKTFAPIIYILLLMISIAASGCGSSLDGLIDDNNIPGSSEKDILVFNFLSSENSILSSDVIGIVRSSSVDITVPYGTDISALVPHIEIFGISINPPDGANQRFNNNEGLIYTVTAWDGTRKDYTITVHVIGWEYPTALSDNISPDGQDGTKSVVAMNANGNAIIVWDQFDGNNNQIYMREYRNGSWSSQPALSDSISPKGTNCFSPHVAMDDNGNAIIVWMQYVSADQIFKSEYRNGKWTHPSSLSENICSSDYSASSPYVAMDNNGNAIITWLQYDGSCYQIFLREFRNDEWTPEPSLTESISPVGYDAMLPAVSLDDNGNAIVAWIQYDINSRSQIFVSEYRGGAWVHPSDITDNISPGERNVSDISRPAIAMDDNNNAIIAWAQYDGCDNQIYMREYRNGSWSNIPAINDYISITNYEAKYPVVAMDNNSNAVIAWAQDDSSNYQIFMREYRNGNWSMKPGLSENISPDNYDASCPAVAMDDNSNAIVTWMQSDGSNNRMYMREYRNTGWSDEPILLTESISPDGKDVDANSYPGIAINNSDNVMIVWSQYDDNNNYQIFLSHCH